MTSKERMNVVLAGGKADRIPIALIADSDYMTQAAGIDHREFWLGDNTNRAEIQRRFWLRHEANDFLCVWPGMDKQTTNSRKLTRDGDRYFLTHADTGKTEELEKIQPGQSGMGALHPPKRTPTL